jgi:hypothetical protein
MAEAAPALATAATAPAPIKPRYRVRESKIRRAEFDNTVWGATIAADTPFDEVLKPDYWANVSGPLKMKAGDEIKIYPEEGHYFATLYVRDVGPLWVKVAVLHKIEFEKLDVESHDVNPNYRIEFRGARSARFCVIRSSDGFAVKEGLASRGEASIWLNEHLKALAR